MAKITVQIESGTRLGWANMPIAEKDLDLPLQDFVDRYITPTVQQAKLQMDELCAIPDAPPAHWPEDMKAEWLKDREFLKGQGW